MFIAIKEMCKFIDRKEKPKPFLNVAMLNYAISFVGCTLLVVFFLLYLMVRYMNLIVPDNVLKSKINKSITPEKPQIESFDHETYHADESAQTP